jgi:hypothetical protein
MGTFLATVVLAVPLATWLKGTFLSNAPQLRLTRLPLRARRDPFQFLEFQNSCTRDAAGVNEVSR